MKNVKESKIEIKNVKKSNQDPQITVDFNVANKIKNELNDISDAKHFGNSVGQIYETKEYHKFSFLTEINRDVDRKIIEKIKKEIIDDGVLVPILVNTKLKVVDGQHRFVALMELGLEILYIIRNYKNVHIAKINNTTNKWKSDNFTKLWGIEGKNQTHYNAYDEILKKYHKKINPKISLRQNELKALIMNINAFAPKVKESFEKGNMTFVKKRKTVEDVLDFIFKDVGGAIPPDFADQRKVQRTIFYLIEQNNFDKTKFIDMIQKPKNKNVFISPFFLNSPQQHITDIIIRLYNKHVRKKKLQIDTFKVNNSKFKF